MTFFFKEYSEDIYNDIFTSRVNNLEHALHSAKDELRSESQMRVTREVTLDRLQEQLRAKVGTIVFRRRFHWVLFG